MERFIYPEVLDAIINVRKMLLIDIKNSKNLIPSEKVKVGSHQCSQENYHSARFRHQRIEKEY